MKNITPELLERYYNNLCTGEERKVVEAWLANEEQQSPNEGKYLEESWQKILDKTQAEGKQIPVYKSPFSRRLIGIAASVVIFLSVGIYSYYNFLDHRSNRTVQDEVTYRNISTDRGQKRVLSLPDGSTITLNAESEVKLPIKFADTSRVVYLIGHAHFDITRDIKRPFLVYTDYSKTKVLGTSFDIKTFPGSEKTEIVVSSGNVEFSQENNRRNKVRLTVNDKATLLPGEKIEVTEVNARHLIAWKDNRLLFENASLQEIVEVLELWYDIEIVVEDPTLLKKTYTFSYDNPPLESLMERMSFVAKFRYSIEGEQVTIY